MVEIHEPFWLYKYISTEFGKKRRGKKNQAISNLRPVIFFCHWTLQRTECVSCRNGRRVWNLQPVLWVAKPSFRLWHSWVGFRTGLKPKIWNLYSFIYHFGLFFMCVYGNCDSVFDKVRFFIAAASSLRQCYFLREVWTFKIQCFYVPPDLTSTNFTFCPHTVFMCFVWNREKTAAISLHSIDWLVFITDTECVYCAVRTGSLYIYSVKSM